MLLPHERRLQEAAERLLPDDRLKLLRILGSSPEARAEAIRSYWQRPETRSFAELLMDLEENRSIALDLMFVLKEQRRREREGGRA